jgi:hypothetical protein
MLSIRTVQTVDERAFFFIRHSSYPCVSNFTH